MELILIRHGKSQANIGQSDDPDCLLCDDGLQQAGGVAQQLAGYDLSGFVGLTSPYRRAIQTANQITAKTGLAFTPDELIREWGPAITLNGRHYPAESREQLVQRLEEFVRRRAGRKVMVVSHASPIAVLTQLAWGEIPNIQGPFWETVPNGCVRWLKSPG